MHPAQQGCFLCLTCAYVCVCVCVLQLDHILFFSPFPSPAGRLITSPAKFPKSSIFSHRPKPTVSRAGDVLSCRGTLTLPSWWGEKRCRTSLGPCWWRAARPIRRRSVTRRVSASPIAIYFTIGQMKRLILTICSLMCFSLSPSIPPYHTHTDTLPKLSRHVGWAGIRRIICRSRSRSRTQLMEGIMKTGVLIHLPHLLFTIVT